MQFTPGLCITFDKGSFKRKRSKDGLLSYSFHLLSRSIKNLKLTLKRSIIRTSSLSRYTTTRHNTLHKCATVNRSDFILLNFSLVLHESEIEINSKGAFEDAPHGDESNRPRFSVLFAG